MDKKQFSIHVTAGPTTTTELYTSPGDSTQLLVTKSRRIALELLNDELFLGIVGEFVRAEQVTVVKCRQAVDVNLSGLRTRKKKDCYNSNSQMTNSVLKGTVLFKRIR